MKDDGIESLPGFPPTVQSQKDIDLRDGILHIRRVTTKSLVPVVKCHIVELLFRLVGGTGCIGISTVGELLDDQIQLVKHISLTPHLL